MLRTMLALLIVLVVSALPIQASGFAQRVQLPQLRLVQASDGTLYIVHEPDAWPLVPASLASVPFPEYLKLRGGEIDGSLPPMPLPPHGQLVVQDSDGSLYLIDQDNNQWHLVPDQISDADLGTLNVGNEIANGSIEPDLGTGAATGGPAPRAAPPSTPAQQMPNNANATSSDIDWSAVVTGGFDPRIEVQPSQWCNGGAPCLLVHGASMGTGNVGDLYGNPAFDVITYGDPDDDGQAEAVIPLNSGGTSGFSGALLYRLGDSTPRLIYAGGDVGGAAAYIDASAHVIFTLFKVGLPPCCPSSMLLKSFKLVNDKLVEQAECRYTPQGDYAIVRSPCTGLGTNGPPR